MVFLDSNKITSKIQFGLRTILPTDLAANLLVNEICKSGHPGKFLVGVSEHPFDTICEADFEHSHKGFKPSRFECS